MRISRAIVTLVSVAALSGGLTGCSDPSNSTTGTPQDTVADTSPQVPSDASMNNTPTQSSGG